MLKRVRAVRWKYTVEKLWEDIFPNICSYCHRGLKEGAYPPGICSFCFSGLSLRPKERNFILLKNPGNALDNKHYPLYALAYYQEDIRHGIRALKFHDRVDFSKSLGGLMAIFFHEVLKDYQNDVTPKIIALPLHSKRARERGYNQVKLVLEEMQKHIHVDDWSYLMHREKSTRRQSECGTRQERVANISNAFQISQPERLENQTVWLMDDVVSSGASMWEGAEALAATNAQVRLLAIASNMRTDYKENI